MPTNKGETFTAYQGASAFPDSVPEGLREKWCSWRQQDRDL